MLSVHRGGCGQSGHWMYLAAKNTDTNSRPTLLLTKKFQDISSTFQDPETFFQNSVVAQQCEITDKQQLLTLYNTV